MPRTPGQARPGQISARVRRVLSAAVSGSKHDAKPDGARDDWPVLAEIARALADQADEARRCADPKGFLAAVKELRLLMDELLGVKHDGDAGRPSSVAADGGSDELAGILGAGPSLGDPSEP